jgi:hypothetical protein
MKKLMVYFLVTTILLAATPVASAETPPTSTDHDKAVTGTILSVNYASGDMLLCQDGGALLTFYGLERRRLRDIGAGDRVAITLRENRKVVAIERIDL